MRIHIVEPGEDVRSIARRYEISPIKLCENNGITERTRLIEGEELLILKPTRTTTAHKGERLGDIARRYGVKESELYAYNPELMGRGVLYDGQPIVVRYDDGRYGMGIGNGYFYNGCSEDKLITSLPYLSFVTVSACVYNGKSTSMLFDDKRVVEIARASGKIPLLRLYFEKTPEAKELKDVLPCALMIAKSHGYGGVVIGGATSNLDKEVLSAYRKSFFECDMKLFLELTVGEGGDISELADGTILTYDKTHLDKIPSFEEGELPLYKRYAEEYDGMRAFVDLSPFAWSDGKYYERGELTEKLRKCKAEIHRVAGGDCILASIGKGKRERVFVMESIENTRKKLEMVSELGFYGISFDIARAPIYELLMFRVMFSSAIGVM